MTRCHPGRSSDFAEAPASTTTSINWQSFSVARASDHDAAEWLPTHNQCWFAATIVAVRREYDLTIDRREAAALDAVLKGCDDG